MARSCRIGAWLRPGLWAAVLLLPVALPAADRTPRKAQPQGELVEVFSGIEKGQIEVQLIARDSDRANLLVKNKTDQPLSVVLPQTFAGVPVLAQFQVDPLGNDPLGNNPNRPQAVGLGPGMNNVLGPGMMNLGNPNFGNPNLRGPNVRPGFWFNVAPEKVGKLKLTGVCLEYGRPNPQPRFKYQIKPIQSVTEKPEVVELCAMLGRGEISQRAAQLAAWHLNNGMSWKELAGLRDKMAVGARPTYTRQELQAGQKAAETATKLAEQHRKPSAGETQSPSRG